MSLANVLFGETLKFCLTEKDLNKQTHTEYEKVSLKVISVRVTKGL